MIVITRKYYFPLGIYLLMASCVIGCNARQLEDGSPKGSVQRVEVRAVFINCENDDDKPSDSEMSRFQRQELFKHNSLRECNKKLALTIRMTTDPASDWATTDESKAQTDDLSGDEYIPVDHVFEGSNKKRVRLLNPYILRLRREPPLQAYKLKKIDTVSGVLTHPDVEIKRSKKKRHNLHQQSAADAWAQQLGSDAAEFTLEHDGTGRHSYSVRVGSLKDLDPEQHFAGDITKPLSKDCEKKAMCSTKNLTWIRDKRHKQKFIPENNLRYDRHGKRRPKDHYQRAEKSLRRDHTSVEDVDDDYEQQMRNRQTENANEIDRESKHYRASTDPNETDEDVYDDRFRTPELGDRISGNNTERSHESVPSLSHYGGLNAKDFAMYEIGSPNLWYSVQVHLFEKMSTPEGKTVWNDMTNGEQASVSSVRPEWDGRDMTVRYRPAEWVARDDFSLPSASLCLLEPLRTLHNYSDDMEDRTTRNATNNLDEYIIVPMEDVLGLDEKNIDKSHGSNFSEYSKSERDESPRRVEVRVSRALFGGASERFGIAGDGAERFLTLPHPKPHRVQIDVEVRADDNQLVRVGSSAAISTVVADNTRLKRAVLTLQATNTGLAAARFRAMARDCGPELSGLVNKAAEGTMTPPMLLPPHHTRRMTIELPMEIPADVVHCFVALLNDEDESVAVRDVAIKKADRCFCVWHCDCVCLSEDPKLLCREMSAAHQLAAGLSPPQRPRLARSVCYMDCITVNVCIVMLGVILALLALGFVKAVIGLVFSYIGSWGLPMLLRMPRKLDRYYENSLRGRQVIYDNEGWPIHPDTSQRVQIVSKPMEFVLNIIFFVALPCILLGECIKNVVSCCRNPKEASRKMSRGEKIFSSHDMQDLGGHARRKRRGELRRWMTPHAEELSTDLWQKAHPLTPINATKNKQRHLVMRPLLVPAGGGGGGCKEPPSAPDSEQDDTDYVLMQMQKSRESLAPFIMTRANQSLQLQ